MPVRGFLAAPVLALLTTSALAATYYASPQGGGDGRSQAVPFFIADFWPVAKPGDTLLLLDGRYAGERSMINPPPELHGTEGKPITVRALNDGKVEIDGESSRYPTKLWHNDHFALEGFNAHSSSGAVVEISRSSHCSVRRVCAWDAQDGNTSVFGIHYGEHNLLEDCAGWGVARKIFSNSQGGDYATYRRCWGRWEGSHVIGPKCTFTSSYNSYHALVENCIGTWDGRRMRETYVLPAAKTPGSERYAKPTTMENHAVDQPYSVFRGGRLDRDQATHQRVLGCIAYVTPTQRFPARRMYYFIEDEAEFSDCIAFIDGHDGVEPFSLRGVSENGIRARDLTEIGGIDSALDNCQVESTCASKDGSELVAAEGHILRASQGATVLYRYEKGAPTDEPLWPWPMNQRIIDAMRLSGYEDPVDVTKTVFELGGGRVPDFDRLYREHG